MLLDIAEDERIVEKWLGGRGGGLQYENARICVSRI